MEALARWIMTLLRWTLGLCALGLVLAALYVSLGRELLPLAADRGVAVLVNRPYEGGGLMRSVRPFESHYRGGVHLAAVNFTGDSRAETGRPRLCADGPEDAGPHR